MILLHAPEIRDDFHAQQYRHRDSGSIARRGNDVKDCKLADAYRQYDTH
jgi:hypothetical protein